MTVTLTDNEKNALKKIFAENTFKLVGLENESDSVSSYIHSIAIDNSRLDKATSDNFLKLLKELRENNNSELGELSDLLNELTTDANPVAEPSSIVINDIDVDVLITNIPDIFSSKVQNFKGLLKQKAEAIVSDASAYGAITANKGTFKVIVEPGLYNEIKWALSALQITEAIQTKQKNDQSYITFNTANLAAIQPYLPAKIIDKLKSLTDVESATPLDTIPLSPGATIPPLADGYRSQVTFSVPADAGSSDDVDDATIQRKKDCQNWASRNGHTVSDVGGNQFACKVVLAENQGSFIYNAVTNSTKTCDIKQPVLISMLEIMQLKNMVEVQATGKNLKIEEVVEAFKAALACNVLPYVQSETHKMCKFTQTQVLEVLKQANETLYEKYQHIKNELMSNDLEPWKVDKINNAEQRKPAVNMSITGAPVEATGATVENPPIDEEDTPTLGV